MDLSQYNNPNFDLSLLNEIADGSGEFMAETIDLFLQQAPELLDEIATAMEGKNWDDAGASAHKLKGTLGMFGMTQSQDLMQQVEKSAKNKVDLDEVPAKFARVKELIEGTYPDLEKIRSELSA